MIPVRVFAVALALSAPAHAQTELQPRCGGLFHLCGYSERSGDELVIPQIFEKAHRFSDDLAGVRIDGRMGYIDRTGQVVIAPRFEAVGPFQNGLAEAMIGRKVGVIDRTGAFVLKPEYGRAYPFADDVFLVSQARSVRNDYGNVLDTLLLFSNRAFQLVRANGNPINDERYEIRRFGPPGHDLIWAKPWRTDQFGLLRPDGTWQVAPTYQYGAALSDGRAIVRAPGGRPSGAVDETGALVVPLEFPFLSYWRNGFGIARDGERHALVARDGSLLAGRYFEKVERPEDGQLARVLDNGTWFSVTPDGALIPDQLNGKVLAECDSGLRFTLKNGFLQVEHPAFEAAISTGRSYPTGLSRICEATSHRVEENGLYGFVFPDGTVVAPAFEDIFGFTGEHAPVQKNGAWGLIDRVGQFVVDPVYDELHPLPHTEKIFLARLGERSFHIDATGNEVAAPPEPELSPEARLKMLRCLGSDGTLFGEGDLWGLQTESGETVIPAEYRALTCYQNGLAWGVLPDATEWCPISPDGTLAEGRACEGVRHHSPVWVSHHYPEELHPDEFESSVLWTRSLYDYATGASETAPNLVGRGHGARGVHPISGFMLSSGWR